MSGTLPFSADAAQLFVGTDTNALTGTMAVLMKTNKYYTDGTLKRAKTSYTVDRAWGRMAVEKGWAEDTGGVLPVQDTPKLGAVSGAGIRTVVGSTSTADATATTAAIRAAIAETGGALVAGGAVYINDTIWLDEGHSLQTANGTTLVQAPGSNKLMVGTQPMLETWETVTVTWTAGNTATVNWPTAATRPGAGGAMVLQNSLAAEADWNTVVRVVGVSGADLTVMLDEFRTASPTGTMTAKRCVKLGRVDIAIDYNFANNASAPQTYDRHGTAWAFVRDSKIFVDAANVYKYGSYLAGCINTELECHGTNVAEILKKYGPLRSCVTRPSGDARDDCATFQAKEPPTFIAYMPCWGQIKDCQEYPGANTNHTGSAGGCFVVYADTDHEIDSLKISGGSGVGTLRAGIAIKHGDTFTTGKVGKVTVEDLALGCKAADYAVSISANCDRFELIRPRLIPADDITQLLRVESTATVRVLVIRGWHFNEPLWSSAGTAGYLINLNGAHPIVVIEGCTFRGRSSQARGVSIGPNGVRKIIFRDCDFENLSQIGILQASSTTTPTIAFENCRTLNVATGLDLRSACNVMIQNSEFTGVANGVVRPTTNAIVVNVYDGGGNTFSTASAITCVAPATAVPYGNLPIDIGATGITKAAGASAFNTGTGRGTIPQNRPVVCDGTNWLNATNLANTF